MSSIIKVPAEDLKAFADITKRFPNLGATDASIALFEIGSMCDWCPEQGEMEFERKDFEKLLAVVQNGLIECGCDYSDVAELSKLKKLLSPNASSGRYHISKPPTQDNPSEQPFAHFPLRTLQIIWQAFPPDFWQGYPVDSEHLLKAIEFAKRREDKRSPFLRKWFDDLYLWLKQVEPQASKNQKEIKGIIQAMQEKIKEAENTVPTF